MTEVPRRASLVLAAVLASAAACHDYPERAPFLCCEVECSGTVVRARKAAPERSDGGWHCARGMPIEYEQACTTEESPDCEDTTAQSGGGGNGSSDGGRQ